MGKYIHCAVSGRPHRDCTPRRCWGIGKPRDWAGATLGTPEKEGLPWAGSKDMRGLPGRARRLGAPGEGSGLQRGAAGLRTTGLLSGAARTPGGGAAAAWRGVTWGSGRARAGCVRGPGASWCFGPKLYAKNWKKAWLQLASADEGVCVHLPHRPRRASIRWGLTQELPVSCGPSRLCSPQPWFHSQALGVAGQLSAEPDPHTLRVLSPRSPSKNLCVLQW